MTTVPFPDGRAAEYERLTLMQDGYSLHAKLHHPILTVQRQKELETAEPDAYRPDTAGVVASLYHALSSDQSPYHMPASRLYTAEARQELRYMQDHDIPVIHLDDPDALTLRTGYSPLEHTLDVQMRSLPSIVLDMANTNTHADALGYNANPANPGYGELPRPLARRT